jgi:hypothetical protein
MPLALLLCRLVVGFAFIAYGTVKLLGGQFYHGDFVLDRRTTDGTWLVWCFFGYAPVFARFIGLCELGPGLLVLFPRHPGRDRGNGCCAVPDDRPDAGGTRLGSVGGDGTRG